MARLLFFNSYQKRAASAPTLMRFLVGLEGLAIALAWWILRLLPADFASALGSRLLTVIGPRLAKHQKIKVNLAIAFPELSRAEVEALARRAWANIGAIMAEYPHLDTICVRQADQRLDTVMNDEVWGLLQAGKPVVFVTAHLANWEVSATAMARKGIPMIVVYSPQQNPRIDRMLKRHRRALGVELASKDQAMRPLMQQLKQGGCVGLVVDLRVDSGAPVPFFGQDMWTTLMPARLALKFDGALVPARVERLQGARYRVTVHKPIRPDDETADESVQVLQMTRKMNALFESCIREHPGQWMCTKRRWSKRLTPDWLR